MDINGITHIAFDADDTLWANENIFVDAKEACTDILRPYLPGDALLEEELYRFERKNLELFGYGIKGFMLSLIETAIELSEQRITGKEIQRLIDVGKAMLTHPVELLPGVQDAIDRLEDKYELLVITKGDLFDQENKLARSGIGERFSKVEIVSEKNARTYRSILLRHGIPTENFLMIGNSLKSDILPIVEIGGRAAHLPFKYTWIHEREEKKEEKQYWEPASLPELTDWLLEGRD